MPLISTEDLIKGYWDKTKDKFPPEKYPDMDYDAFERICKTLFHYIRHHMQSNEMPTILVKGWGKFVVLSTQVQNLIIENKTKFKKGYRGEEAFLANQRGLDRLYKIVKEDEEQRKYTRESAIINIIEE